MIKVNLKSRKAAVGVTTASLLSDNEGISAAKGKFASMFERVSGRASELAGNQADLKATLILVVVYATLIGGAWWYSDDQQSRMLAEVTSEISAIDSKLTLLDSELNKTKGYEQIKKSLEADEKTIRTKISTIQELIQERATPPKILMTLSEAIPANLWLKDFSLKDRKFHILGSSDGMDVVADFVKSLEETVYFKGVVLKSSKQENKGGRLSAQFELEADRR